MCNQVPTHAHAWYQRYNTDATRWNRHLAVRVTRVHAFMLMRIPAHVVHKRIYANRYNNTVARDAVAAAFGFGYRHVDTAFGYENQKGVGMNACSCACARVYAQIDG